MLGIWDVDGSGFLGLTGFKGFHGLRESEFDKTLV